MLVLSRKVGEKIQIGENVVLVINRISGNRVSIGIEAPDDMRIVRGELDDFSIAADTVNDDPQLRRHRVADERISPGSNAFAAACE